MSSSFQFLCAGAALALSVSCQASSGTAVDPKASDSKASVAPKAVTAPAPAKSTELQADVLQTSAGPVRIFPLQHGTLRLEFAGKHIYVDPWSPAPLPDSPKADLILITDIHGDHLDAAAVAKVSKPGTVVVGPAAVAAKLPGTQVLANGEQKPFLGIGVMGVPMYNHKRGPEPGKLFHDPGRGNGYVLTLGDKRLYLSGDTACTNEMKALQNIDVAFVCMNLPYTMPPDEAAECVAAFEPKVVYPYHYRGSDLSVFEKGLAGHKAVEVRLRKWYP